MQVTGFSESPVRDFFMKININPMGTYRNAPRHKDMIMLYFPLTVNDGLADMVRTATELKMLLDSYVKNNLKGADAESFPAKKLGEMQNTVLDIITTLGDVVGYDISTQALRAMEGGDHEND